MLRLPTDWQCCCADYLVRYLLKQPVNAGRRAHVARCLIGAAFDIGFIARWNTEAPHLRLHESPRMTWHIGDMCYQYLPLVNDDVIDRVIEQGLDPWLHHLLIPSEYQATMRAVLDGRMDRKGLSVQGIDEFVALRACFSSMDAKWGWEQANREFFNAYNRRAATLPLKKPIIVRAMNLADSLA